MKPILYEGLLILGALLGAILVCVLTHVQVAP